MLLHSRVRLSGLISQQTVRILIPLIPLAADTSTLLRFTTVRDDAFDTLTLSQPLGEYRVSARAHKISTVCTPERID